MDAVQGVTSGFALDLGPLKEPIGFIRVLEWVFTICAFATTGGYSGSTSLQHTCPGSAPTNITTKFGYPFRLSHASYDVPYCNSSAGGKTYHLQGDFNSSAEFFVCIGVFGFLYCTATLILYLGYQHIYRQTARGPIIDLVITAAFAFMWLVSSSAWGKGLTDVKWATNPDNLAVTCGSMCKAGTGPFMGRLNGSVIFGFLNLILWAGNCWFIYKETPFHKDPSPPANMPGDISGP
ncbi:uncharacterized protein V6R79_020505 [Siganus canaliculatus]